MERNTRILVVDDQQDLREQLGKLLMRSGKKNETVSLVEQMRSRLLGSGGASDDSGVDDEPSYYVDTAGQGEEAFQMVKQALEIGRPYAVMFLDMRMPPGWDGLETAKKIRGIDPQIEIVIMTAYADHDQEQIAEEVGCPEKLLYIKKPFQAEEIHQLALSLTSKWSMENTEKGRKGALELLLRGMSRIKSSGISGSRECYETTLKAILDFTRGEKGFIALYDADARGWQLQCARDMDDADAGNFISEHGKSLSESRTTQNFDGKYLLPLKRGDFSAVAVVYDIQTSSDPEWYKFLSMLTMTATEVLSNSASIRKSIEKERFSAIGIAVSKLSHEGKNMLGQILTRAGRLREKVKNDTDAIALTDELIETGEAMLKQLQNVLIYSKDEPLDLKPCDLSQIIRTAVERVLGGNFGEAYRQDGPDSLTISGDAALLNRAFANLASNASKAAGDKLRLTVEIGVEGEVIRITVSDNGSGIPEEIEDAIFDPFISSGKLDGIGLGLPIVNQIIEKHGGSIRHDRGFSDGTRFIIQLPKSA